MGLHITYLLFKLKLLQPSEAVISRWTSNNEAHKLRYTLSNGNYHTRLLAAKALGLIKDNSSIPILMNLIHDKIQTVSIAALNALEQLDNNTELAKMINHKRFVWLKLNREKLDRDKDCQKKKSKIHYWKRSSKKSFEMVKERLKRPIR